MSMPVLPAIRTRDEAINAVLTSIALEETALSHIINAEGEKIQYALAQTKNQPDLQMILKINESAAMMLEQITDMQLVLINKLGKILKSTCAQKPGTEQKIPPKKPPAPKPCHGGGHSQPPPQPPCRLCASEFKVSTEYDWCGRSPLLLKEGFVCGNGVELGEQRAGSYIRLPAGRTYRITLDVELGNRTGQGALIEARLDYGALDFKTKEYPFEGRSIVLRDAFEWAVPDNRSDGTFKIKLLAPKQLKIYKGEVTVTEV